MQSIPDGNIVYYRFSYEEMDVRSEQVHALMGNGETEGIPEPALELVDEIMAIAPEICNIEGGYLLSENIVTDRKKGTLTCGPLAFQTGQIISAQLRKATAAAWFVCTVGKEISDLTSSLMKKGDLLKGYVVDVLANVVVELAMDRIQDDLRQRVKVRDWNITNRYSPGYCGWDISEQQKLFSLLPVGFAGVHLTASSLMQPIKSVSGVIGLGREVQFNPYTCNLCSYEDCIYRNKKLVQGPA